MAEERKFKRTPSILSRVRGFFSMSSSGGSDQTSGSLESSSTNASPTSSSTVLMASSSASSSNSNDTLPVFENGGVLIAESNSNSNHGDSCVCSSSPLPSPKSCPLTATIAVNSNSSPVDLTPIERKRANSTLSVTAFSQPLKAKSSKAKKERNKYLGLFSVDIWYQIMWHLPWRDLKKMLLLNKEISKVAKKVCNELRKMRNLPLVTMSLPTSGLDACVAVFFVLGPGGKIPSKRKSGVAQQLQQHCVLALSKPALPPSESDIQIDSINSPIEGRSYVPTIGIDFGLCSWTNEEDDSHVQNSVRVGIADGQNLRFFDAWIDSRTESFKKKKKSSDEEKWLWFLKRKEVKYRRERETLSKHAPIAVDELGNVYVVSEAHTNDTLRVEKRDGVEGNIIQAFSEMWPLKDVRGIAAKVFYKTVVVSPVGSPVSSPGASPAGSPAQSPFGSPATSPSVLRREPLTSSTSNETLGKDAREPRKVKSKPTLAVNSTVIFKEQKEVSHTIVAVADFSERSNTSRLHIFDGDTGEHLRLIRECNKAEGSFSRIDIGVDDEGRDVVFVVDKTKGVILVLDLNDGKVLQQIGAGNNDEGQPVLRDPKSVLYVPPKNPNGMFDLWVVDNCTVQLF